MPGQQALGGLGAATAALRLFVLEVSGQICLSAAVVLKATWPGLPSFSQLPLTPGSCGGGQCCPAVLLPGTEGQSLFAAVAVLLLLISFST